MARKELLAALEKEEELELTVRGRKSGKDLPRPVWFVMKNDELLLLPVKGSDTQWYKNILKNPQVTVRVQSQSHKGRLHTLTDKKKVSETVELFRKKYGAGDIARYYPKLDVGASLPLA